MWNEFLENNKDCVKTQTHLSPTFMPFYYAEKASLINKINTKFESLAFRRNFKFVSN